MNENYKLLNGKEFRLMWQTKDSKLISKFNVIVKNLPKNISSKELQSEFSNAGDVFSAKIPTNSKQNGEGFGFVCFFDEEAVDNAITLWNEKELKGKKIFVERYDKKKEEQKEVF
jgi:polyadenylate-binding protein